MRNQLDHRTAVANLLNFLGGAEESEPVRSKRIRALPSTFSLLVTAGRDRVPRSLNRDGSADDSTKRGSGQRSDDRYLALAFCGGSVAGSTYKRLRPFRLKLSIMAALRSGS
jgi:hypothetical protein